MKSAERFEELRKLALRSMSRKDLLKNWERARKEFAKAQEDYDKSVVELAKWQSMVDNARERMAGSRQVITETSQQLKTMDLTGAKEIRDRTDAKTYMIEGKEYYVDDSDVNDIKKMPYRQPRSKKTEQEE